MDNTAPAILMMIIVIGGLILIAFSLWGRQRMRELAVRERIAMIERGLVPSPETDPDRFERIIRSTSGERRPNVKGTRYRSAGVMLMGLGGALFLLVGFTAGIVEIAFGVGGAFVVLGLAVFVNGLMLSRDTPDLTPLYRPESTPKASTSAVPPPNVGP